MKDGLHQGSSNSLKNADFVVVSKSMRLSIIVTKGRVPKKTDYLVTLIKRVGRYLAEITIS